MKEYLTSRKSKIDLLRQIQAGIIKVADLAEPRNYCFLSLSEKPGFSIDKDGKIWSEKQIQDLCATLPKRSWVLRIT